MLVPGLLIVYPGNNHYAGTSWAARDEAGSSTGDARNARNASVLFLISDLFIERVSIDDVGAFLIITSFSRFFSEGYSAGMHELGGHICWVCLNGFCYLIS